MGVDENPFADAIILLEEFGVLLLHELLGVRDDQFSHNILRLFVSVRQIKSQIVHLRYLAPQISVPSTTFSAWVFPENLLSVGNLPSVVSSMSNCDHGVLYDKEPWESPNSLRPCRWAHNL